MLSPEDHPPQLGEGHDLVPQPVERRRADEGPITVFTPPASTMVRASTEVGMESALGSMEPREKV
jgi:hypothetical protein